jgi:hypothetical protein
MKTLQKRTIPQASDSELVDEKIYPLCPSQKAETDTATGKRAERMDGIVFVVAFNPVRHGLLDECAFVKSVHSVISF